MAARDSCSLSRSAVFAAPSISRIRNNSATAETRWARAISRLRATSQRHDAPRRRPATTAPRREPDSSGTATRCRNPVPVGMSSSAACQVCGPPQREASSATLMTSAGSSRVASISAVAAGRRVWRAQVASNDIRPEGSASSIATTSAWVASRTARTSASSPCADAVRAAAAMLIGLEARREETPPVSRSAPPPSAPVRPASPARDAPRTPAAATPARVRRRMAGAGLVRIVSPGMSSSLLSVFDATQTVNTPSDPRTRRANPSIECSPNEVCPRPACRPGLFPRTTGAFGRPALPRRTA